MLSRLALFIQLSEQGTGNGQEEPDLEQALPAQVFISALFLQLQQHRRSKLSWTFSPCPALTKRRCLLLGPNWRSHVLFFFFFFCRHFHLYITKSHILCAYYIEALVCFLSAKSVQKSVYKAQPIFSPYRVKQDHLLLFFFFSLEQMGSCRSAISDTKSAEPASSQKSCRRKTS